MKTAVVLSGGGAKGAYQIGVWKALRKLNIKYDIVTGTSVGALNGAMMVQNDFLISLKLWKKMDYQMIFNDNFKVVDKKIYQKYIKGFITEGGLKPTNLENVLSKVFNENKFYTSPVDYGIVVYNVTEMKHEMLTKKDLNRKLIKDYIIASASCFPAFKMKQINKQKYIDGGFYDNLPINLAIDMGADKIIAIDLEAPGIKRKIEDDKKDITIISPKNDTGSFLEFDSKISKKNIKFGYNDTMKQFKKMEGNKFSFNRTNYNHVSKKNITKFKQNLNKYSVLTRYNKKYYLDSIEYIGKMFEFDESKIYFLNYYNYKVKKQFNKVEQIDYKMIKKKIKKHEVKSLLGTKYIVKYIYQNLKNGNNDELNILMELFKKEFLAAVYLITIED